MTANLAPQDDRWLEDALRADATGYLDDAGFTARVMDALPPPAAVPRWRKPAVAALWALAAAGTAIALPGAFLDVARETYKLIAAQPVSLPQIATVVVALGIATWSATVYALRSE